MNPPGFCESCGMMIAYDRTICPYCSGERTELEEMQDLSFAVEDIENLEDYNDNRDNGKNT